MDKSNRFVISFLVSALCTAILSVSIPAPLFSQDKTIAKLTDFSGTVIIRSLGKWEVKPEKDLPLYSGDKVVTQVGKASIRFNDEATIDLEKNSNLRVVERKEKNRLSKDTTLHRRLRILLGKFSFKSGRSKTKIFFETPTSVCGLRGTAGQLIIGEGGRPYIEFSEGGTKFTVGDFLKARPMDLSQRMADSNPVQRASFGAKAAAEEAGIVAERLRGMESTKCRAQVALYGAMAAKAAGEEIIIQANIIITSNADRELVKSAKLEALEGMKAVLAAQKAIEKAIKDGAETGTEGYEPPAAGGWGWWSYNISPDLGFDDNDASSKI